MESKMFEVEMMRRNFFEKDGDKICYGNKCGSIKESPNTLAAKNGNPDPSKAIYPS